MTTMLLHEQWAVLLFHKGLIHRDNYAIKLLLYSRKAWQGESLVNLPFSSIWYQNVSNRILIISTNLDGFSLANQTICQIHQCKTLLLYSI